jgi:succinate dehydrogenase / fumarate reductase iron-sulfur subunit
MAKRTFRIWRGDSSGGDFQEYTTEVGEGMVVLDAIHQIQAESAGDMAVRWNCKAGKCGSCSVEINGKPKLSCMTRMNSFGEDETITVQPMKAFPVMRDLVCDVSHNYKVNKSIPPFSPKPRNAQGQHVMMQEDVDRIQEFRKCIECFLCMNVCHVLRDHEKHDEFAGPRWMIRLASLEMHPLDNTDRIPFTKEHAGSGWCNITRCCTDVCPEHINITDNGIIPMKERVVDRYYDPIAMVVRKLFGSKTNKKLPVLQS